MRTEPTLKKPRTIGGLRKDKPAPTFKFRCSCGEVFTMDAMGILYVPDVVAHNGHEIYPFGIIPNLVSALGPMEQLTVQ